LAQARIKNQIDAVASSFTCTRIWPAPEISCGAEQSCARWPRRGDASSEDEGSRSQVEPGQLIFRERIFEKGANTYFAPRGADMHATEINSARFGVKLIFHAALS
jgi:hypothetical protein